MFLKEENPSVYNSQDFTYAFMFVIIYLMSVSPIRLCMLRGQNSAYFCPHRILSIQQSAWHMAGVQ